MVISFEGIFDIMIDGVNDMSISGLLKLKTILEKKIDQGNINYVVPDLWNAWDYDGSEMRKLPSGELLVNPYRFYASVIGKAILANRNPDKNYNQSLSRAFPVKTDKKYYGGDWVRKAVLYSTMIRTSTTWDHDRSYSLDVANFDAMKETGTFVKTLALLPFLKKIGVDTVYMLPISKFSLKDKKGELGSPYGVASFFDLDPNLKDPMTGKLMTVEEEFQAFVEACHILSMRVIIDIIPRTNAVENDLIKDHPDWFYWIKASEIKNYKVPYVDGLETTLAPEAQYMPQVYASKDVLRHIGMFQSDPRRQNEKLWNAIVTDHPGDVVGEVEKQFDLKIAPAFSDHINDVQPPWTDVTFFRLYMDMPKDNVKYLADPDIPPYILFDTIKANMYPGNVPNLELWNTLSGIIPFYQTHYGIDGARIDMGHALPKDLLKMIIDNAKANDKDFAFIAEEMDVDNAPKAKELGYNIIIGNGFWMEPRIFEKKMHKFVYGAKDIALPMFACAETHDTARIAGREGGRILARMTTVFNMFLPNLVPFLNSGQEVYETQPMNTGVDCTEKDKFNLPKDDLCYGKLALFDKYAIHYLNNNRWELADHLDGVKHIRARWINELTNLDNFVPLYFSEFDTPAIGLGYYNKATGKCLLVFANTNFYGDVNGTAQLRTLRDKSKNEARTGNLVYSTYEMGHEFHSFSPEGSAWLHLGPGEVKIIEL
jgi:starch synthase (maltosyl-transferring)